MLTYQQSLFQHADIHQVKSMTPLVQLEFYNSMLALFLFFHIFFGHFGFFFFQLRVIRIAATTKI